MKSMSRCILYLGVVAVLLLTPASGSAEEENPFLSSFKSRWETIANREVFKLTPYRANYFLPVSYNSHRNEKTWEELRPGTEVDDVEVKFQLSGQIKAWDNMFGSKGDMWFAYTQRSFWQLYNSDESAPFRETNYEPEFFVSWETDWNVLGLTNRFVSLGFVHQSNGRGGEDLSRSWNRIYARVGLERGNFGMAIKGWWRIPEDEEDDDNPGINNYMGYGELDLAYMWKRQLFHIMLRNNLNFSNFSDNRGAIQADWVFPLYKGLRGYVQYFNGYGESLIDYNTSSNTISVGFMLLGLI